MSEVSYANYSHYLTEGWKQDKQYFQDACDLLLPHFSAGNSRLLDVGCATGNFLAHMLIRTNAECWGLDCIPELLVEARRKLPQATFIQSSALNTPEVLWGRFSCITAFGLLSCFKAAQLPLLFDNLFKCAMPGKSVILLFNPLNEFGVDLQIDHRKRHNGEPTPGRALIISIPLKPLSSCCRTKWRSL